MQSDDPDPEPNISTYVVICVLLVIFSAFFSATETAFSAVNRTKLKVKAQEGNKAAKNALKLTDNYDKLISTILVGNNIVNIALATLAARLFAEIIQGNANLSDVVSTIVSTVVVLIFGELTPKMIAKDKAEGVSMVLGYPIKLFMVILFPITILFSGLKFLLKKIFKLSNTEKITEEELLTIVEEAQEEGSLDKGESELISSSIEFDDVLVEDILVPRVGVVAVSLDMSMDEVKHLFFRAQLLAHARI